MTIVCFSHLSWDRSLFQRPQQLMSRFSRKFNVLYVNSHSFRQSLMELFRKSKLHSYNESESLAIYSPFTLPTFQNKLSFVIKLNRALSLFQVRKKLDKLKIGKPVLWIYHPRYVHTIGKFDEKLIVYDCMDDFTSLLSSYEDRERNEAEEEELLRRADIAFAGGYSIADLKKSSGKKIHVFPSAVDISHFQKVISENLEVPEDVRDIPHPILGYWGAIDDRIDHELLKKIAVKCPEWSIVLLGPIPDHRGGKASYLKLREFKNIYWLGAKDYSLLPNYAQTFDVCLNPFVLTREGLHLSPTKTLEYLATGKPVVSTPITDVVRFYGGVVKVAGAGEFIMTVKKAMEEEGELMRQKRTVFAADKTWDKTVEKMEKLISDAIKLRGMAD